MKCMEVLYFLVRFNFLRNYYSQKFGALSQYIEAKALYDTGSLTT